MAQRKCRACETVKDEADFAAPKPSKNYRLRTECKACLAAQQSARYRANPKASAARMREYRAANRAYRRRWNLWTKYRITPEEYDALLLAQGGVCAICRGPQDRVSRDGSMWFDVDHCHKTGRVRGLLCHSCNTGIGKLKDAPDLLRAAALYLEAPPVAVAQSPLFLIGET